MKLGVFAGREAADRGSESNRSIRDGRIGKYFLARPSPETYERRSLAAVKPALDAARTDQVATR
jgi:hypothetical protein